MRKIIFSSIIGIFIFLSIIMMLKILINYVHKEKITENIKTLPEFYFYKPGTDSIYTNTDIEQNKATLIVHFHPECEHCRYEAKAISKQINDFEPYQLLFISHADAVQIETFAQEYKLTGHENIIFLEDKDMVFDDVFGKSGVPASFIYNKKGKLVKQFKGEVKVETLLKYLKE